MRFYTWFTGMMLLGAALACAAPGQVSTAPGEPPTAQVIVITATPPPVTAGPLPSPTSAASQAQPSATPATGPRFSPQIKFSTEPNPATATRTFKQAAKRIYAMWDYADMSGGLTVRREWYLNGTLWLKREEKWDVAQYGASGTVKDVSIYDEEVGLPTGQYELRLYIDDKPQFSGAPDFDFRTFTVGTIGDGAGLGQGPGGGSLLSPDGKTTALVENGGTLSVLSAQGVRKTLVTVKEIDGFTWLPDSLHIAYSTVTSDGAGPFGTSYDAFIVNVSTGGTTKLSSAGENLHLPVVSPTGKYIALLMGTGYGDACGVDRVLAIMEIDPVALTRVSLTTLSEFNGVSLPPGAEQAYTVKGSDFTMPGIWQGATQFKSGVSFTCVEGGAKEDGVYAFDMLSKSATKTASLPPPP